MDKKEIEQAIIENNVMELINRNNRKNDWILVMAILLISVIYFGAVIQKENELERKMVEYKRESIIKCERFKESVGKTFFKKLEYNGRHYDCEQIVLQF